MASKKSLLVIVLAGAAMLLAFGALVTFLGKDKNAR